MSDSIQSIRFVPQLSQLNQKGRTSDKKGDKENKKDFSKHMSDGDKNADSKGSSAVKKDHENTGHKKQNDENLLQEKADDDFDDGCGSILDAEV